MKESIKIGYQVGTGAEVNVPLHHTVITGITQLSGKTTTLEALIHRSGLKAVAFRTKRGEGGFKKARQIPPFFRERTDWMFVEALLEAAMNERMKFERGSIMRVCEGARTLRAVWKNVQDMLPKARGINQEILTRLDGYMKLVIPEIERITFSTTLNLLPGVNMIDLIGLREEMQCLVVASVIQEINDKHSGIIVIVPEANEFLPQQRGSPAKLPALRLARKGAAVGNYLWMDTQDIAGVDKTHLKQVGLWILGIQTEENEVVRTLKHIPNLPKPTATQIRGLNLGHFYGCYGGQVKHIYAQPIWLSDEDAKIVATAKDGTVENTALEMARSKEPIVRIPDPVDCRESGEVLRLREDVESGTKQIQALKGELDQERQQRLQYQEKVRRLKKHLQPQWEELQALFAEIGTEAAGNGEIDRSAYDIWMPKAGEYGCKLILEILIQRRRLLQQQLSSLGGKSWKTFTKYRAWLVKNHLAKLDGDYIEIVPL